VSWKGVADMASRVLARLHRIHHRHVVRHGYGPMYMYVLPTAATRLRQTTILPYTLPLARRLVLDPSWSRAKSLGDDSSAVDTQWILRHEEIRERLSRRSLPTYTLFGPSTQAGVSGYDQALDNYPKSWAFFGGREAALCGVYCSKFSSMYLADELSTRIHYYMSRPPGRV